jgi:hypothetical protein
MTGKQHHEQVVAIVGRLHPGAYQTALELVALGPPFDLAELGVDSQSVFVSEQEVIWIFEGQDVEVRLRSLLNDPVTASAAGAWGPLLSATPHLARLGYGEWGDRVQ